MRLAYWFLILPVVVVSASIATAAPPTGNTGPGGFEATNVPLGSTGLEYWLRADVPASIGIQVQGANNHVSSWTSQTASGQVFAQSTLVKQPLLTGQTIGGNALPAMFFDGNLTTVMGIAVNADELVYNFPSTVGTVILVNTPLTSTGTRGIWGVEGADVGVRTQAGGSSWQSFASNNTLANNFTNTTGSGTYVNGQLIDAFTTGQAQILSAVRGGSPFNLPATSIGDYFFFNTSTVARSYHGVIGEIVAYDRPLNLAERQIVDNALSAKYDIPIFAAADVYAGDLPGNGNFDKNVFGVGRVNSTNVLSSAGQAGLGIEVTAGLDDGDYILAGHRVDTNSFIETPTLVRSSRSWYIDGTGLDGNEILTLAFDLSDAGLGVLPEDAVDPILIFSPDSVNFDTYSILASNPTIVGDTFLFSITGADVQQFNSNGLLTFAFSHLAVPEPATWGVWILCAVPAIAIAVRLRRRVNRS